MIMVVTGQCYLLWVVFSEFISFQTKHTRNLSLNHQNIVFAGLDERLYKLMAKICY